MKCQNCHNELLGTPTRCPICGADLTETDAQAELDILKIRRKNLFVAILLSVITFGIYGLFWRISLMKNIRTITKDDRSHRSELLHLIFAPYIYTAYWHFTRGGVAKREITARGEKYMGNHILALVLSILGLQVVATAIMQHSFNSLPYDDNGKAIAKKTPVAFEEIRVNKRPLWKCILFTVLTLGIYGIYWKYLLVKNTRILTSNEKKCGWEVAMFALLPLHGLHWWFTRGELVRREFAANNKTGVLKGVWMMLIALACPIVAMAMMQHTFNTMPAKGLPIPNYYDKWKAWIYLSPAIVLLIIFTAWPLFNTVRMAFLENYGSMSAAGGITFEFGLGNFIKVLQYKRFITCLTNTILLCVLTVPISTILALLIAVALNSIKPLQRFLQTIFFLPYVTNSIAIGMVFAAMFNMIPSGIAGQYDSIGIINNILQFFGFEHIANLANSIFSALHINFAFTYPINWINIGSEYWANIAVLVVYIVWNAIPFKILVLLGGLQGINKQYYDAAKIDGTSRFRTFMRVTVPLLSPMITYVIITSFIGGFKEYSSIVGIFGETMGPIGNKGRLNTMVGFIYDALQADSQGRASAAAIILFGIIFVVTMINLYFSKKKTHY